MTEHEQDRDEPPPLVQAEALSLTGSRGRVYGDVDLAVPPRGFAVVSGESGTGRTCLLLSLAGRMRPTGGTLSVAGRTKPHDIQKISALGATEGVNDLEPALSVAEHVFEASHLRREIFPRRQAKRSHTVAAALAPVGLDLSPDALVEDLRPHERILFGVALALAARPELLLVDDADRGLPYDGQRDMWAALGGLGVTTIATCVDAGPADGIADLELALA